MVRLGEPITILWGKHHGKKAWINADQEASKSKFPIVYVGEDSQYYKTSVYRHMVVKGRHCGSPRTLEEAAFEQIPELEKAVHTLTLKLAMCGIREPSPELLEKISRRLNKAVRHQAKKGTKALWVRIDFDPGAEDKNMAG